MRLTFLLLASLCCSTAAHGLPPLAEDVKLLGTESHRLTSTQANQDAAQHIREQLRLAGVSRVLDLGFPVVALGPSDHAASLAWGDAEPVTLHALRPNLVVPSTVGQPITAPLIYAGRGGVNEWGRRSVEGAVVALEYDCGTNWERAFARGAAAVVFLGNGHEQHGAAKHAPVPLNLPRFYVDSSVADALRQDRDEVVLESRKHQSTPHASHGTNLVAFIPGTDPQGEAMVVTTPYDTFGVVPTLSPAARRAANVSGLLQLAQTQAQSPPKRDMWLLFQDAGAQRHRGARVFYDAVTMDDDTHRELTAQHEDERQQVAEALRALEDESPITRGLRNRLQLVADAARADLDRQRQLLRRHTPPNPERIAGLGEEIESWDRLRRWLNQSGEWDAIQTGDQGTADQLQQNTTHSLRLREIELRQAIDQGDQREALRQSLGRGTGTIPRVVLHVDLDLSDTGSTWSAVTGDWTDRLYEMRSPKSEADGPGFHVRVLAALRNIAERAPDGRFTRLDLGPLQDSALGKSFVPCRFVNAGSVAGGHGIYHVALMTGHDARVRDGQPSDTLANFNFENFEAQLGEALALIADAADDPALSIRPSFPTMVVAQRTGWDGKRPTGNLVTRRVTGGLSENRPAQGATVALWPGEKNNADAPWRALSHQAPADYLPFDLVRTNQHGRFEILGLRYDIASEVTAFAYELNEVGELAAVPTQTTLAHGIFDAMRVDLFSGRSFGLTWWGGQDDAIGQTKIMRATSDAAYRPNLSLVGRGGRQRFWVLADRAVEPGIKVFEAQGPVALGMADDDVKAYGVDLERFAQPADWADQTARDMWQLNEGRLAALRQRGVTSPDLEVLHAEAGRAIDADDAQASKALSSAALSQGVYPRLRSTMDDLVYAIVVLLLLTIPFAFAMERLVFGAAGVYGRIAGFVGMFFATFAVLYATHPGFAVASTPVMIFLAFAIVLLSCMVIWVLVRRFQSELAAMQGRPPASDGGGMRGVGAAVSMGMSTMRRRPTRTILTATTVVMLTFTVLCFASVRREIGVRSVALGPATEAMPARSVMVRELNAGPMSPGVLDLLAGVTHASTGGNDWLESWWRVPTAQDDRPIVVARPDDGRAVRLGGVMGIDPKLLDAWPKWSTALGVQPQAAKDALIQGKVFLPADTMATLELAAGDAVLIDGRRGVVAGATEGAALSQLRQVDGESWLPIDVAADAAMRRNAPRPSGGSNEASGGKVLRLSAAQVVVASNTTTQRLGGDLRSVTQWVGDAADPNEIGRLVAAVTGGSGGAGSPVWATGSSGAERLTLGGITRVSGVWRLVAPVLLGGLIIFGTLLGSISDRQKEIYTFSALGLGPRHVGMLFFAEAAVYAVVGGLGGQMLAQVVALLASWMSAWGWISPVSINFASTQALFAIGVVMATVMISAIYPAIRASKSANPGLARAWTMPPPEAPPRDHELNLTFPFTVSAYDLTGVVAFLAEHFRQHADAGLGPFAAADVNVTRDSQGQLQVSAQVALAPFDLGVTQQISLTGVPSDIPGVDEVAVRLERLSGTKGDWVRANRVFVKRLRRQFLVWRTLPADVVEAYRMATLELLGEAEEHNAPQAMATGSGGVALA